MKKMIEADQLVFSYTKKPFIEQMSFAVEQGEIFGFLGPSGAGKSTIMKILIGLLAGYHGSVRVNGTEVKKKRRDFYEAIGVDFEFPSLYLKMTGRQNLKFFGSLYQSQQDAGELLAKVGLLADGDKLVSEYSKGMKSRLNFIKALIHDPDLLFLDEPTSGLDPVNAKLMKDMIRDEQARGKTIILTTHNMHDAAELCDRVAFIVDGGIKALDCPHNMIMARGAAKLLYTWREDNRELSGSCNLLESGNDRQLADLIRQGALTSIHSTEPTLNEIFIEVTGRTLL